MPLDFNLQQILRTGNPQNVSSRYALLNGSVIQVPWDEGDTLNVAFNKANQAIEAINSLDFPILGENISQTQLDKLYTEFPQEKEIPKRKVIVDPEASRLSLPGDVDVYDFTVKPEFKSDQPGSQFEAYRPDIERMNAIERAMAFYGLLPMRNAGRVEMEVVNGLHKIHGRMLATGLNSNISLKGQGTHYNYIETVTYSASTRGSEWSMATILLRNPLVSQVVVGMAFGSGNIQSIDSDTSQSSSTPVVNDHVSHLNGAHIITSISTDRKTVTVDVPHRVGSTTRLVGGQVKQTGKSFIGLDSGRIVFPLTQLAFTGGFDGRGDESIFRSQYGGNVFFNNIAMVDHTDPVITRDNGFEPDRKNVFVGNICDVIFNANVVCAGAEGHVFRAAKMVNLTANQSYFGAVGLNTRAGRTVYMQLNCMLDMTRCAVSGGKDYNILITANSLGSAQNCVNVNSEIGAYAITGSSLNIQKQHIIGCGTGTHSTTGSFIFYNGDTVFENCDVGARVDKDSRLEISNNPKYINCGTDVIDLRSGTPLFSEDLVIDKTKPKLTLKNGTFEIDIENAAGPVEFKTGNRVHQHQFGYKDGNGDFVKTFVFNHVSYGVEILGNKVLGTQRPAIADPGDGDVTVVAILNALRTHGLIAS